MACGCQKNQAKQAESAAARSTRAAQNQAAQQEARQSSAPALSMRQPVVQGGSQSFALEARAGRTQSFRSPLEARAERMRRGGTVPTS